MFFTKITQYLFIFLLILIDFYSIPLIFFTALIQFSFFSFIYINGFWLKFLNVLCKNLSFNYLIMILSLNYYYEFHGYIVFLYFCIISVTLALSIPIFLIFYYTKLINIELHIETLHLIFNISKKTFLFFFIFYDNNSIKNLLFFVWLLTFLINLQPLPKSEDTKSKNTKSTSKDNKSNRQEEKVASITETELEKLHNHIKSTNQSIDHFSFESQIR